MTTEQENQQLRRVIVECITNPGALCFSGKDDERFMRARLEYINSIATTAIEKIEITR